MRFFRYILLFYFTINGLGTMAQKADPNANLADICYRNGEFAKAISLYESLYGKNPDNFLYYNRYVECLIRTEDTKTAEKLIRKQIKKYPTEPQYRIDLGNLYNAIKQPEKANAEYENAIKALLPDRGQIENLAFAFERMDKTDLAINTYIAGRKLLKSPREFTLNIATILSKKTDKTEYINILLDYVGTQGNELYEQDLNLVQANFQDNLLADDYSTAKGLLLKRVNAQPNNENYSEMLIWLLEQTKDYGLALTQVIAKDKRNTLNGRAVLSFARLCTNNTAYDVADKAFQYIINMGSTSELYASAKQEQLEALYLKVTSQNYDEAALADLESKYSAFFTEFGKSYVTASVMKDYAAFLATYRNKATEAIALLNEILGYNGLTTNFLNQCKMALGDVYVFKGEVFEAILLYGQVDKAYKGEVIGQEARFRNARLSYFMADFDWAKAQVDVLKASTAQLIANDALNLSLLITENKGDDTIYTALEMYAEADLLVFQNRNKEAITKLDSITTLFPKHPIEDDILWLKAKIAQKENRADDAIKYLEGIVQNFGEDIWADDALYALANIYLNKKNDRTKAQALYQTIIDKYPGSYLIAEARKAYRALRGDVLN